MEASAKMQNLWRYIDSLQLSYRNRKWLAERLMDTPAEAKEDEETISKEEILANLDSALKEVKLYREGKLKLKTLEEALNEL